MDERTAFEKEADSLVKMLSFNDESGTASETSELQDFIKTSTVDDKDTPQIEEPSTVDQMLARIQQDDHNALNHVLLEILSPQLERNEEQKRILKESIMPYIKKLLIMQLIVVSAVVAMTFLISFIDLLFLSGAGIEYIRLLTEFLKYYITAIIVELIAILFFIVKYVFDKSIVDLMREQLKK